MSLGQCIKSHSHREYLAWMDYFQEEMNVPDRTDHYLMAIACEVRRVLQERPAQIKPEHFKIKFEWRDPDAPRKLSQAEIDSAKLKWFSMFGMPVEEVAYKPPEQEVRE